MALNVTHPSPLDDDRIEYRLHLTPDLLPDMEELLVPGPVEEEIKIQVRRENKKKYSRPEIPKEILKLITCRYYLEKIRNRYVFNI